MKKTNYRATLYQLRKRAVLAECEIELPDSFTEKEKLSIASEKLKDNLYIRLRPISKNN